MNLYDLDMEEFEEVMTVMARAFTNAFVIVKENVLSLWESMKEVIMEELEVIISQAERPYWEMEWDTRRESQVIYHKPRYIRKVI